MMKLPMAALATDLKPPIVLDETKSIANFHAQDVTSHPRVVKLVFYRRTRRIAFKQQKLLVIKISPHI